MSYIILILFVLETAAGIQLGRIQNAGWVLNSSQMNNEYINIPNITCERCVCEMLAMENLTTSIACQQNSKTCQILFWNATAQLQTDEASMVYFQTLPKFLQTTARQQPTTALISSKSKTFRQGLTSVRIEYFKSSNEVFINLTV